MNNLSNESPNPMPSLGSSSHASVFNAPDLVALHTEDAERVERAIVFLESDGLRIEDEREAGLAGWTFQESLSSGRWI